MTFIAEEAGLIFRRRFTDSIGCIILPHRSAHRTLIGTLTKLDLSLATVQVAWERVNKDFGSIFATLLPGTSAKLQPPAGQSVLDGLEVKVGYC